MESNRITRQSKSDDSANGFGKGQSQTRSKVQANSSSSTNQKKGKDSSVERVERPKRSYNNLHDNQNDHAKMKNKHDNIQIHNGATDNTPIMDSAGALTENSAIYHQGNSGGPLGMNHVHSGSQEAGFGLDRNSTNQMETAANWTPGAHGNGKPNHQNQQYTNKSDSNIAGGNRAYAQNGMNRVNVTNADAKKRRKNSDKAQRKASNNKKVERDVVGAIPPIDQNQNTGMHPRSHSRGAAVSSQSQGNNHQNYQKQDANQTNPNINQQYFDQFNPFMQQQQNHGGFPMNMNGGNPGNNGFPFNNQGHGPFMGGNNQAPQVHFIAKKQQFIAQISPEQLMGSDKRPYTAQSLNNLSANAKRAGNVYANAMANTTKSNGTHGNQYNIANAAFTNYPAVYLGGASRTHTQGFGGFNPHGNHKFSKSIYGEDVKPKIAGKDILHAMGASNGFSSGYNSDPYSSVMSQGLPQSLTNSTRPAKHKPNRLGAKEKEQLYDEAIKMKVLNNQLKEDHVKMKTKIKILENELNRKEKTIEDLFGQNQIIQQSSQKTQSTNNQGIFPVAHTASKYQQETFLVMSLKKQIREFKYEATKKDEELEILRKNIKNTRTKELEQEILAYHEECLRLRQMMEDVIKQGPSHPIHIQGYVDRANQMQAELNHKDIVIGQLTEQLNNIQNQNNQSLFPGNLSAIKSPDATKVDITTQDANYNDGAQGLKEKSVERRLQANQQAQSASQQVKDLQKDLQRARKQLREKEKEMVKMRADVTAQKKESQEKVKNDTQQNKDSEQQLKTLKDKLRESKNDNKRKEDKLLEGGQKAARLEEQLKSMTEQLKAVEDSNKTLKNQMRSLKQQKSAKQNEVTKSEPMKPPAQAKDNEKKSDSPRRVTEPKEEKTDKNQPKVEVPRKELALMTLIGQREKLSRDDLTTMMLAGEESLKMLIRQPTEGLIDFIKANLDDEDALLAGIPRFEMPKTEFENQVLREMRIVLRENADLINEWSKEDVVNWAEFEIFYEAELKFEYPHKDKLLEFIKYFFLDHIVSAETLMMNFSAFKDHLFARRRITPDKRDSSLRSRRRSEDSASAPGTDDPLRRRMGNESEEEKHHEEERMLDIAEQCFMRIADLLHMHQRTVKQAFLKYAQPEQFKDGSVLELISPRSFLDGVKDIGFDDVTELEAACLMKVLAKPELENSVILNEFVLIMENFGIPTLSDEEEYENDYIPDSDAEAEDKEEKKDEEITPNQEEGKEDAKEDSAQKEEKKDPMTEKHAKMKDLKSKADKKQKNQIIIKFDVLDEKGSKILKKLARFLLQRYMHPREFFGPTIKKETYGAKKCKVEIIKHHDFYLRLKLASIRKKLKENVSINNFLAIDGDKFPGVMQVKRMIKALEIIAEGEQELMVKEQEEKAKEFKLKCEEFAKDREAKGLPPMTDEEIEAELRKDEKDKDKDEKDAKKSDDFSGKPPAGPSKPAGEEFMRIGSKASPKGKDKDGPSKNRFASHLGPGGQLNTIEEDLHETQTSHYSYQVKDGEGSEREGSKHQLSTSNHLRGSHPLNELEDSSRRSVNSDARAKQQALGASVGSGDYSGGSNSSAKKAKHKDIETSEINVNDFKKAGTATEKINKEKKNELEGVRPDDFIENRIAIMESNQAADKPIPEENEVDMDDADFDEKMDDEINSQLNKQLQESVNKGKFEDDQEDGYSEDEHQEERASTIDQLKEDTINTQKIEQLVEDDMKDQEREFIQPEDQISDKDRASQDELDMEEGVDNTAARRNSTPDKPYEDDIEEYSYHDEVSETNQDKNEPKGEMAVQKDNESDIEEDYEF